MCTLIDTRILHSILRQVMYWAILRSLGNTKLCLPVVFDKDGFPSIPLFVQAACIVAPLARKKKKARALRSMLINNHGFKYVAHAALCPWVSKQLSRRVSINHLCHEIVKHYDYRVGKQGNI
jgi:hypothetical protein